MLEHHAKTLARDLVRGKAGAFSAQEYDAARGRALDAHPALHRRRFSRAVRPDQAKDLTGMQIETQILDGGKRAEPLGQAADVENGRVCDSLVHHEFIHQERASRDKAAPRKPPGKNSTTSRATAETMNVASSPVGLRNSPATIRKMAPSAAPSTVRRPPSTADTMTCTPTATPTTVPTDAVPK